MNEIMSEKKRDRLISFIKGWADGSGFTEDDLDDFSFDVFERMTKSKRIQQLCRIAYFRAHGRAVKTAYEMSQPISFRIEFDSTPVSPNPFTTKLKTELLEHMIVLAESSGVIMGELYNWTLDGFGSKTKSENIMSMVRLAYYRGWCKGIQEVYDYLEKKSDTAA